MTSLMKGNVIDGKAVGDQIRAELVTQVAELKEKYGKVPGLAVVIVGRSSEHEEL
jgi:methylenetetrahydrofolate dehydrogenase (NADP+)/methenyltetrahydrofolate cyclohydrolase